MMKSDDEEEKQEEGTASTNRHRNSTTTIKTSNRTPTARTTSNATNNKKTEGGSEGASDKAKRRTNNCWHGFTLCCFKLKQNTKIQVLEFQIKQKQQQFGIDYLTLVKNNASQAELKDCIKVARTEIGELQKQVNELDDEIDTQEQNTNDRIIANPNPQQPKPKPRNAGGGFIEQNMKKFQQINQDQAEMQQAEKERKQNQAIQRKLQNATGVKGGGVGGKKPAATGTGTGTGTGSPAKKKMVKKPAGVPAQ